MDAARFDFDLPESAIAQVPCERRDGSRLMHIERATGKVSHHIFRDLPDLLPRPHCLVRNNAAVFPARLRGRRAGGGAVECLLLHPTAGGDGSLWSCLLKPGKKLPEGARFALPDGGTATVEARNEEGVCRVRFAPAQAGRSVLDVARAHGEIPLPPYIRREQADPRSALDRERYQTVYAAPERPVAAAAPTAGLHFTPEILAEMARRGHATADLTLHVGLGTFKPLAVEKLEQHAMHAEFYEIPASTRGRLRDDAALPVLAVGTTALRAIEDHHRHAPAGGTGDHVAEARLFLYPPARFRTEALITNFHLPRSTLVCLVAAFLAPEEERGIAWIKELYAEALARGYRFYSYGDAMLIT